MNHMVPALLAIEHNIQGQITATSSASASGAIAIGEAFRLVKYGILDSVICGGMDINRHAYFVQGMENFGAACNFYNERPEEASRPYDRDRKGPIIGDGGALFLVESEEVSRRRKRVYAEISGFHQNCDAFHILRPTDSGAGLKAAVLEALRQAGLRPEQIDLVNSHATSTPVGDQAEAEALSALFNHKLLVSAQKGHVGHSFCAAGAVESAFALKSLHHSICPHILNLHNPLSAGSLLFPQTNI